MSTTKAWERSWPEAGQEASLGRRQDLEIRRKQFSWWLQPGRCQNEELNKEISEVISGADKRAMAP